MHINGNPIEKTASRCLNTLAAHNVANGILLKNKINDVANNDLFKTSKVVNHENPKLLIIAVYVKIVHENIELVDPTR